MLGNINYEELLFEINKMGSFEWCLEYGIINDLKTCDTCNIKYTLIFF